MNPWGWIEILVRSSLEGGLLILAVWAVCRLWPGLPAWTRSGLWWLASARLLVGLLPLAPLTVPAPIPVTAVWWPAAVAATPFPAAPSPANLDLGQAPAAARRALLGEPVTSGPAPVAGAPVRPGPAWDPRWLPATLVLLWVGGISLRACGLVRQGRRVRSALRAARPLSGNLGGILSPATRVRLGVSREAPVPLVTGLFRPTVLIPAAMLGRPRELALALSHELAHVRRGDLWFAWVPALAEAVFWFHPLVRLGVREYVQACEEACDAEALRATGAHPHEYGRLLLDFGVHRRLAGATAMPCGSPSPRQLTRRLSMLKPFVPSRPALRSAAIGLLCAFALVGLVPLRVVPTAASPGVSEEEPASLLTPASAPRLAGPGAAAPDARTVGDPEPAGAPVSEDEDGEGPEDIEDPGDDDLEDADLDDELDLDDLDDAPAPPAPPRTPRAVRTPGTPAPAAPARAPRAPRAATRSGVAWGYDDDRGQRFSYVLVKAGEGSTSGTGNIADWQEVKRLRTQLGHDFLWVRVGDRRYLIEDEDMLRAAEEAFRPQREIGERQSEVGEQQSRIGERQSEIGEEQARIGERQSELAERQAEIAYRMSRRNLRRADAEELEQRAAELSERMEDLGREQERLGERMEPLGRQMEELGAKMEVLARQMEQVSKESHRKVRALVEDAIRSGAAKPLR
jgi:beta-lactamase regulating signal transducer with metallopeptidase domain